MDEGFPLSIARQLVKTNDLPGQLLMHRFDRAPKSQISPVYIIS